MTRAELLVEHADLTVDQAVTLLADATTADDVYDATWLCLLVLGWHVILTDAGDGQSLLRHIRRSRARVGLVDSETERRTHAAEAEQRLIQQRAAVRASA